MKYIFASIDKNQKCFQRVSAQVHCTSCSKNAQIGVAAAGRITAPPETSGLSTIYFLPFFLPEDFFNCSSAFSSAFSCFFLNIRSLPAQP